MNATNVRQNYSILITDDDRDCRESLREIMEPQGFRKLLKFLQSHPAMKETDAVKQQRFVPLRYEELTPGPANIRAIEKMAAALAASNTATVAAKP